MTEEYVSNSHKSKEMAAQEQEKKVEKVVTGVVKQKKKSEIRKFADIFIAKDVSDVKDYIFNDVIVPAIKDAIEDVVHMVLRGESGKSRNTSASKVSYRDYYGRERDRRDRDRDRDDRDRGGFDYDEYIIKTRGEAEDVLSQMDDILDRYRVVSIADYCDLLGIRGPYTNNRYGWTDLRNAQVVRVRGGYVIKLPRPMPTD